MNICLLQTVDDKAVQQLDELLHKLDPSAPALSRNRLEFLCECADFKLFTASDQGGDFVGMLTLTCCQTLSRPKYWIEDVVVDPACRGKGAGRALVQAAVRFVKEMNDGSVIYLTSNPSRTAARNLYRSEGFEEYETGVFRIK
jgi:ribosomal protein S18 acetylase RimI-like enzyme